MKEFISYYEHESVMVHMERSNRRMWILCLILILALIGTNGAWIYYESQWEYTQESTQIEAQQEGELNIVGGGDVTYGTESQSE